MAEIDYIRIEPDSFGWKLTVATNDDRHPVQVFGIGDAIQFHDEVERTIGRWLADGPADFHATENHTDEWRSARERLDMLEVEMERERVERFLDAIDSKEETDHGR